MNRGSHTRFMLHEPEMAKPMGWKGNHNSFNRRNISSEQMPKPIAIAQFACGLGLLGVLIHVARRLYASLPNQMPWKNLLAVPSW